ncbi:Golgi resident protein GCP60 [Armadillidium nasatum]|uniref:Golgi resident protein GCP60 n=1 Tax=Armadillidium nasatum TaxID=96803 RepID=A0A5N5TMW6_9CRUS|nr:Golgi resident protein GCP60 [Armadillidium nasatum]
MLWKPSPVADDVTYRPIPRTRWLLIFYSWHRCLIHTGMADVSTPLINEQSTSIEGHDQVITDSNRDESLRQSNGLDPSETQTNKISSEKLHQPQNSDSSFVNGEGVPSEKHTHCCSDDLESLLQSMNLDEQKCPFSLQECYKVALKFYKDMSGKAIHLSYEDNCYFVALSQQIIHGPFNPATAKTLAWQSLGNITKEAAITRFIERLNNLTPTFKPYLEAVLADRLEKERLKKEEEEKKQVEEKLKLEEEEHRKREEEEMLRQEETKRQIQEALNQQTFEQFKLYAEQQFPGNPEQQAVLIRQLQEQHYQQYMQQCHEEEEEYVRDDSPLANSDDKSTEEDAHVDEEGNIMTIAPAKVWTRKDIKDFKNSIRMEGGDSVIKIGHGETVTVRVPTHKDGSCLFWEFATDSYDIGFGIIFEWRKDASSTGVTVHVTESDDDDEEEEEEEEDNESADDSK